MKSYMASQLDFRYGAIISSKYVKQWNKIAYENHKPFTELIDCISRRHTKNVDWFVSSPASRNNLKIPLFHYCCCLVLLQELIRAREPIPEIVVDSKALKKIIDDYLVKERVASRVIVVRLSVARRLKVFFLPLYLLLQDLLLFFFANLTRSVRYPLPPNPLTLIDTFVLHGYIEEDRYYPGLRDALSDEEKKTVWFVPCYSGIKLSQSLTLVRNLRKSQRNFILKEDFLKPRDYLFAYSYLLRGRRLKVGTCTYQGIDISGLIKEELISLQGGSYSFLPLINYRFAKRLNESGVKLRLVVNWFENQDIDRGWNAGFRRFFPDTPTIGYQGFVAIPHYLCMFPSVEEEKNSVIPHEIMVMGKGLMHSARKFCADLDVKVAPAFRYQHVWQDRKFLPDLKEYTILVALPILPSDAIYMLTSLALEKSHLLKTCRVRIKSHPALSASMIKKCFPGTWPKELEFVSGEFNDCVEQANLLISCASSTCLETLAKGIPVIIMGNRNGLTHNPIPESITEDIWRLCYTLEELEQAVEYYKNRGEKKIKEHEKVGAEIRKEYFESVTIKKAREFLKLDIL